MSICMREKGGQIRLDTQERIMHHRCSILNQEIDTAGKYDPKVTALRGNFVHGPKGVISLIIESSERNNE